MLQVTSDILSFAESIARPLGWALLHTLWQGALIFILYRLSVKDRTQLTALHLYAPMGTILSLFIATFILCIPLNSDQVLAGTPTIAVKTQWMTVLLWIWCVGMMIRSVQFGLDYYRIRHWKKMGLIARSGPLFTTVVRMMEKIDLSIMPELRLVKEITVPMVVGVTKPVLLFPVCLLNQLTQEELENILLHELHHVKRKDYFWNLLLCLVEVIFFFNPFILLLIKDIRAEREITCDRAASSVTNSPKALAKALVRIHEISNNPKLAMAINSEGKLTERVYALLDLPSKSSRKRNIMWVWGIIIGLPFILAFNQKKDITLGDVSRVMSMDSITIPGVNHVIHSLEFKTVNGRIQDVKINEEGVELKNDQQVAILKETLSETGVESNRKEEFNSGLKEKYHSARVHARKAEKNKDLPVISREDEIPLTEINAYHPVYDLAKVEGYNYGKSYDTLNSWAERLPKADWHYVTPVQNDKQSHFFFELPSIAGKDGIEEIEILYDDHQSSNSNERTEIKLENVFEALLLDLGLIPDAHSYAFVLSSESMTVNGVKATSKLHKIFKEIYLDINRKNPQSKFNYQILKNQMR